MTLGVGLATTTKGTAMARISWTAGAATVSALMFAQDDASIIEAARRVDKVAIDCPFGWPDAFVDFVADHADGGVVVPEGMNGGEWRRTLAYRLTDLELLDAGFQIPSVSSDRIGRTAMRCAMLLDSFAAAGVDVDRTGRGLLVEVNPAVSLKQWGLKSWGYKTKQGQGARELLVGALMNKVPWLKLGIHEDLCRRSDHALDAVLGAMVARGAALGQTSLPPEEDEDQAGREGWIALPLSDVDALVDPL